jgi:hypothetical protein
MFDRQVFETSCMSVIADSVLIRIARTKYPDRSLSCTASNVMLGALLILAPVFFVSRSYGAGRVSCWNPGSSPAGGGQQVLQEKEVARQRRSGY